MSNQQLSPQQKSQELFMKLSQQYKTPLRTVLGEAEELVQTSITNLLHQLVQMNGALEASGTEIARLQKLLKDNNIDTNPKQVKIPENKIAPVPPVENNKKK